ncbi:MAG: hypothetical protein ABIR04_07100 [Cypionkella sp.]
MARLECAVGGTGGDWLCQGEAAAGTAHANRLPVLFIAGGGVR